MAPFLVREGKPSGAVELPQTTKCDRPVAIGANYSALSDLENIKD